MQSPSARSKAFILRPSGGLKKTERFSSPVGRGLARKGAKKSGVFMKEEFGRKKAQYVSM